MVSTVATAHPGKLLESFLFGLSSPDEGSPGGLGGRL